MALNFDGPNKLVIITSDTIISVRDMWSRWLDWFLTDDNSKFGLAMRQVGGDDIDVTAGTSIPIYIYLLDGWKIRPKESSHTLNITDGILLVEGGGDPFVNPLGAFTIRINYQQPVQALTVSTGGGGGSTPAQIWNYSDRSLSEAAVEDIADKVWDENVTEHAGANTAGKTLKTAKDQAALAVATNFS